MKILNKYILGILLFTMSGAVLNGSFRNKLEQRRLRFSPLATFIEQENNRLQLSKQLSDQSRRSIFAINRFRGGLFNNDLDFVEINIKILDSNMNENEFKNNLFKLLRVLNFEHADKIIEELSKPYFSDTFLNFSECSITFMQLALIIPILRKFKLIKKLNLSKNDLTYLPTSIGRLKNLEFLILNDNKLNNLPNSINRCEKLDYLDLCNNPLEHLFNDLIDGNISLRPALNLYISDTLFESESNEVQDLSGDEADDESGSDESSSISVVDLLMHLNVLHLSDQ